MSGRDIGWLWAGLLFGVLLGYLVAYFVTTSHHRSAAIEAGVARWAVDPKTGDTRFEWITCEGGTN